MWKLFAPVRSVSADYELELDASFQFPAAARSGPNKKYLERWEIGTPIVCLSHRDNISRFQYGGVPAFVRDAIDGGSAIGVAFRWDVLSIFAFFVDDQYLARVDELARTAISSSVPLRLSVGAVEVGTAPIQSLGNIAEYFSGKSVVSFWEERRPILLNGLSVALEVDSHHD